MYCVLSLEAVHQKREYSSMKTSEGVSSHLLCNCQQKGPCQSTNSSWLLQCCCYGFYMVKVPLVWRL